MGLPLRVHFLPIDISHAPLRGIRCVNVHVVDDDIAPLPQFHPLIGGHRHVDLLQRLIWVEHYLAEGTLGIDIVDRK